MNYNGKESGVECFDSWERRYDEPGEFPDQLLKKPILEYERNPHLCTYLNVEYIVAD